MTRINRESINFFFVPRITRIFYTGVFFMLPRPTHMCRHTHHPQVASGRLQWPIEILVSKTTICFMLLACFPEHIHVESCVEKKSNQRFLKLQFLYFIGMEAWRLLFSHNFVKTWPVSKETGLFYVSMIVFVCLCAKQKKTHTRSEDLQNHVFDLTHLQLDNPVLYSDNMVSIEPGCVGCILKPLASGGGKLLQNWALFEVDQRHLQLLCWCVVRVSLLSCLRPCVNQGNNQSEMGWTGPGWSHRAAHNSCSGQFKDRSTEQSEGVSNSMAWTGEAFLFTFFHVNIVSTSPYTCVVDTPHHVAQTIPTHIIHHKWHVYQHMLVLRAMVRKKGNQRFLKLQFLYFIGMEAWRLYSSHTTLSNMASLERDLAFFTSPWEKTFTHMMHVQSAQVCVSPWPTSNKTTLSCFPILSLCLGAKLVCYFETKQLVQQQLKLEKTFLIRKFFTIFMMCPAGGPDMAQGWNHFHMM